MSLSRGLAVSAVFVLWPIYSVTAQDLSSPPQIFKTDMVRAINAPGHWRHEDRTWRYQTQTQTRFVLGNAAPQLSSGLRVAPVGGVGLTDQWQTQLFSQTLQWRYGATVGLVDHSQDLYHFRYSDKVGRAWFDLKLTTEFSIDGVYQRSEGYEQLGLGTQYQLGFLGNWSLFMQQSEAGPRLKGYRYQGRVDLDLTDQTQLQLRRERYRGDFVRLNQSRSSPTPEQRVYGATLSWDAGRWGVLKANYANTVVNHGEPQQAIGVGQQLWYSPNVRIDLDAQRQTHTGDYNVGLRFSLPLF